jgi:site-specific DNA-methyltransferase (adenine-specific)
MLVPFYESEGITIYNGDCLEVMPELPDGIADCILCDLPYGVTACKWDAVIPFEPLWEQYKRLIKKNAAIVLTASQPFTSALVMSNPEWFRHEWIWRKTRPSGSLNCARAPLREHENILMFSAGNTIYNPQMVPTKRVVEKPRSVNKGAVVAGIRLTRQFDNKGQAYPRTVLEFGNSNYRSLHPTQKPVALMEYLIRTYTNEGDLILDNTMGSGTTLLAAMNTGRKAIGIELSKEYCEVAVRRLESAKLPLLSEAQ